MKTVDSLAKLRDFEREHLAAREQLRTLIKQVKQLEAWVLELEEENASVRERLGAMEEGAEDMQ